MNKIYELKASSAVKLFAKDDNLPYQIRIELLKKCVALKYNPTPKGHTVNIVKGENIYKLRVPGARILYTIENKTITILVVLVNI